MNEEIKLDQNKKFFDRWAKSYDTKLFQFWMRGFQKPILTYLKNHPKAKVLDVSCGTGQLLKILSQNKNLTLSGIDLSEQMITKARTILPPSIDLKVGNVLSLPYQNNTFDITISTEAFHHYPNQEKALQELTRITKPQGQIIIVDINFFLTFLHRIFEKIEPGCNHINSRKEMQQLFEANSLSNITQHRSFLFAVITKGTKISS